VRLINRLTRLLGFMVVPRPPSAKMLREHANTSESFHPSRGGNTVRWMRHVAELIDGRHTPTGGDET